MITYHYKPYTRKDAPNFFQAIDEIARKAGDPSLMIDELHMMEANSAVALSPMSKFLHEQGFMITNANGKKNIAIGSEMAKLFDLHTPDAHITPELKAVLAHEMGHVKNKDLEGFSKMRKMQLTHIGGAIAGVVGVALAKHLMSNHPNDPDAQRDALDKERQRNESEGGFMKSAGSIAIYTAGGLLGLYAGMHAGKIFSHNMEHAADAFANEIMGDSKPLASALEKIEESIAKDMESLPYSGFHKHMRQFTHPTTKSRIAHCEAWTPSA